jgi:uncharacterized membrane protein YphA (DoxX/SURF4 family)
MSAYRAGASLIEDGMPGQRTPRPQGLVVVLLIIRVLVGVVAVVIGVLNARGHAAVAAHAADWGLPAPGLATWLGCALLIVFGLGLALGLATRLCALVVLLVVLVLVATAGRVDGGVPLFGGALLAAGCLVLLARGGGARQLLDRIDSQEW